MENPVTRIVVVRNNLAMIRAAVRRYDDATPEEQHRINEKLADRLATIADHMLWLEDRGHLRFLQEMMAAERAEVTNAG